MGGMSGGAGVIVGGVSLANTSSRPCQLTGFPTLRLLTAAGTPVTGREQRSPGGAAWQAERWDGYPRITLDPGQRVQAPLGWQNYCGSRKPAKARLSWRGETTLVVLAEPMAGLCLDDAAPAGFAVGRWQPEQ